MTLSQAKNLAKAVKCIDKAIYGKGFLPGYTEIELRSVRKRIINTFDSKYMLLSNYNVEKQV